jgi:hypothetical protein
MADNYIPIRYRMAQEHKEGVYETIYGNAAVYEGGDTAVDIDADEEIPIALVDFSKFIRALES